MLRLALLNPVYPYLKLSLLSQVGEWGPWGVGVKNRDQLSPAETETEAELGNIQAISVMGWIGLGCFSVTAMLN